MINLDDLLEDAKPHNKKSWPLTVFCEPDLESLVKEFKRRHGKQTTAEVIRRLLRAGLPLADQKLKSKLE